MTSSIRFVLARRGAALPLVWLVLGVPLRATCAHAQEGTAPANGPNAPATSNPPVEPDTTKAPGAALPTPVADASAPLPKLSLGAELFYGTSNLAGAHRFQDGFWLGAGPYFPSNVYALYNAKNGASAKVALSIGKLYRGQYTYYQQPIEAWVAKGQGATTYTLGKFYVPFEIQEWQYQTQWGAQAVRDLGARGTLTGALTLNTHFDTPNGFVRYARTFGAATVGVSLGGGRGFSFDTDHDRGAALDLTASRKRWRMEGSAMVAQKSGGASSRFRFAFVRLNYALDARTRLYLARHSWDDRLGQQGRGHFSTLGAVYQLNPHLALEGAVSRDGDARRTVNWIQLHYTIQK